MSKLFFLLSTFRIQHVSLTPSVFFFPPPIFLFLDDHTWIWTLICFELKFCEQMCIEFGVHLLCVSCFQRHVAMNIKTDKLYLKFTFFFFFTLKINWTSLRFHFVFLFQIEKISPFCARKHFQFYCFKFFKTLIRFQRFYLFCINSKFFIKFN